MQHSLMFQFFLLAQICWGKIVRKSKLGYISSDVEILGIKTFLESCLLNKLMTIDGQEYLKLNTVNSFLNTLLN